VVYEKKMIVYLHVSYVVSLSTRLPPLTMPRPFHKCSVTGQGKHNPHRRMIYCAPCETWACDNHTEWCDYCERFVCMDCVAFTARHYNGSDNCICDNCAGLYQIDLNRYERA
jgi:hypothetical protein